MAPEGHVVQLSFSQFSVEAAVATSTCSYDYVAIYNGYVMDPKDHHIAKYCGDQLPPVLTSTGNVLTISFVSDDSVSEEGFLATYNFINARNSKKEKTN